MSDNQGNASLVQLLAAWTSGKEKTPEEIRQAFETLEVCGGANLFLTRKEADKIQESGAKFDGDPHHTIPAEGRGCVRLRCKGQIMTKTISEEIPGSEQKYTRTVKYGLCSRCSGWELAIRKRLRDEATKAEQEAKTGTRRRGFREDAAQ